MTEPVRPDVVAYVCNNCVPEAATLPRQWQQDGAHVVLRVVPCSGKMDGQYLLHSLEGGVRGVCVVACPKGECQLAQGNYRAEIRVATIRRLLAEIGLQPERLEIVHWSPEQPCDSFDRMLRNAADRICALGPSPLDSEADLEVANK